jgi:hypothetical protein
MRIDDFRLPGASIDEMTPPPPVEDIVCFRLIERVSIWDKYIVLNEYHHRSDSCYDNVV